MRARTYGIEIELASFETKREVCTANGGRLYMDCGHIEIDTPECLTPREVALYDKSNERTAAALSTNPVYKNNVAKHVRKLRLAAYGRHENFYAAEGTNYTADSFSALNLFLATRTMFDGSGKIDGDKYRTSQRARFVVIYDKRLCIDSTDRYTRASFFKEPSRMQICTGDSTLSEIQTAFNVAITSIVLDIIEDGKVGISAENKEILRVFMELPYQFENFGGFKVKTTLGKMSAIAVQRYFFELAAENGADPPILRQWSRYLDVLESGEYMELRRDFDWATKLWIFDRSRKRHSRDFGHPVMQKTDILFHRLGKDDKTAGLYEIARAEGHVDTMFSEEEISAAATVPPKTRASGRVKGLEFGLVDSFEPWGNLYVPCINLPVFEMPDPFKTYADEVEEFARKHGLASLP